MEEENEYPKCYIIRSTAGLCYAKMVTIDKGIEVDVKFKNIREIGEHYISVRDDSDEQDIYDCPESVFDGAMQHIMEYFNALDNG